jgi:hypothetical protein
MSPSLIKSGYAIVQRLYNVTKCIVLAFENMRIYTITTGIINQNTIPNITKIAITALTFQME